MKLPFVTPVDVVVTVEVVVMVRVVLGSEENETNMAAEMTREAATIAIESRV
jgi:hypothetical protein